MEDTKETTSSEPYTYEPTETEIPCLVLLCYAIGRKSIIPQPIKATHIQKDIPHQLSFKLC
ncbi:hypothetical protein LEMLEM_LOCUS23850, partial [Lemmus lemmus]